MLVDDRGFPVSNHGDWLTKCHSTIVITQARAGFNEYTFSLKRDWLEHNIAISVAEDW